jgi:hypothetical protein
LNVIGGRMYGFAGLRLQSVGQGRIIKRANIVV